VQALLESVVADPDAPILRLNILSAAERDTVEHTFNATDVAPSQLMHAEQTMHGAFEHWAATRPDAPALVYGVRGRAVAGV
jgi:non-ribosomal peptide synthetase component F